MYRRSVIPNVFVPKYYAGGKKDVSHCECSRQSILYVLGQLLPDKNISVELQYLIFEKSNKVENEKKI